MGTAVAGLLLGTGRGGGRRREGGAVENVTVGVAAGTGGRGGSNASVLNFIIGGGAETVCVCCRPKGMSKSASSYSPSRSSSSFNSNAANSSSSICVAQFMQNKTTMIVFLHVLFLQVLTNSRKEEN
jgi:hypothetical protein